MVNVFYPSIFRLFSQRLTSRRRQSSFVPQAPHKEVRRRWTPRRIFLASFLFVCGCTTYIWRVPDPITDDEKRKMNRLALLYRQMPFNTLSRIWGNVHQLELPKWMRSPTYRLYTWLCACNLDEALQTDLTEYRNLSEFFRRPLKPELRPIDQMHALTSPADGRVLYLGRVEQGQLEQVKGITYTLKGFLGPLTNVVGSNASKKLMEGEEVVLSEPTSVTPAPAAGLHVGQPLNDGAYQEMLKHHHDGSTHLYHCVIYLAPGDYHRFHSPTDWSINYRRHFTGKLLSVNPRIAKYVHGLFSINERVVYFGEWQKGFFSYTAVGATNVGSISVFCDPNLRTNQRRSRQANFGFHDLHPAEAISQHKGDLFGEFNLGSTLVLIFEAPKDFRFVVSAGEKLKFGQPLGK